jgi:hypothetical protein
MSDAVSPAGWLVRVTTFDAEDTPTIQRRFYVAEPDKARAVELAADLGETGEALKPLTQSDLDELGVGPGLKREYELPPPHA